MTERHAGYVVTLDQDIREDDAQAIMDALSMVKGVLSVDPIVADSALMIAQVRARCALVDKITAATAEILRG